MPELQSPARSLQQRLDALERANEIRIRRASLKRDIYAGRAKASDVIEDPPEWAGTMKVAELLRAVPKVGRVKVGTILDRSAVSPSKTLAGLSNRQRAALMARLGA